MGIEERDKRRDKSNNSQWSNRDKEDRTRKPTEKQQEP